jgi:hypothetical protein
MKVNLGFEALPYTTKSSRTRRVLGRGVRIHRGYGAGKTSVDVAKELEEKYKLVETFWNLIEDATIEQLEEAFVDDVEEVMQMQALSKRGISDEFTDKIEDQFKRYLDQEEHGIKTLAASRGVSHLLPRPYSRSNPPRPSFIDTGLYRGSFRAWVEDVED